MPQRQRQRQTPRIQREEGVEIQLYPEIVGYTVMLTNGTKSTHRMDTIEWLLNNIYSLQTLILCFMNPRHHPHYYPYSIHNVVLEKRGNVFIPHFYHYYNVNNERIDIPIQQQYYDFCAVEQFLFQNPLFYNSIYTRMMRPLFIHYSLPPNAQEKMTPIDAIS